MNKLIGEVMAAAKLKDGTEVEIRFDKFHYRAYNLDEQQVGPERVNLDTLITEIGGALVMEQGTGENAAGGRDKSVLDEPPANTDQPELPAGEPGSQDDGHRPQTDATPGPEAQNAEVPNLTGQDTQPELDEQGGDPRVH